MHSARTSAALREREEGDGGATCDPDPGVCGASVGGHAPSLIKRARALPPGRAGGCGGAQAPMPTPTAPTPLKRARTLPPGRNGGFGGVTPPPPPLSQPRIAAAAAAATTGGGSEGGAATVATAAAQTVHARCAELCTSTVVGEQAPHTDLPQQRQWCRRRSSVKRALQCSHWSPRVHVDLGAVGRSYSCRDIAFETGCRIKTTYVMRAILGQYEARRQTKCTYLCACARAIDRATAQVQLRSSGAQQRLGVLQSRNNLTINTKNLPFFITTVHIMMRTPHPGRSAKLSIIELSQY